MSELPAAPERIRIRQIAICAPDIRPVERAVERHLDITPVHRDKPGAPIWMYNGVFPVGNTFLEILQPERPEAPTQKFLEKQGGAAGYMLILQVDDFERARARAEAAGVRIVADMPKRAYHGVTGCAIHLHPADTGGVLTSFDWMEDWESWAWAGAAWPWHQRTDVVSRIVAAEVACADPAGVGARFAELLGRPLTGDGIIELEDSSIRFTTAAPGDRDRLTGIDMTATDRSRVGETFEFCRTTIRLV
jgi:catechol 2,3-dioxygenase-like lactoylglutathione lyase family enzyme